MTTQKHNAELANLMSIDFQGRNEPQFAIANAIPTMLMLPGLRALWSFSSINESGNAIDLSGQGRTLTNNGGAPRSTEGLVPYASMNGTTQYFSRADDAGLDITGTLTLGGWFKHNSLLAAQVAMSKWDASGDQRSYSLQVATTGEAIMGVSPDGTAGAAVFASSAAGCVAEGAWSFTVGRFIPSSQLSVSCNGVRTTVVAGVPASIKDSSAALLVGGISAAAAFNGYAGLCFVSAAAVPLAAIDNLFQQTRAAFGV
jgi:hypothetical protein